MKDIGRLEKRGLGASERIRETKTKVIEFEGFLGYFPTRKIDAIDA